MLGKKSYVVVVVVGTYPLPLGSRCTLHVLLMTNISSLEYFLGTDLFQSTSFLLIHSIIFHLMHGS